MLVSLFVGVFAAVHAPAKLPTGVDADIARGDAWAVAGRCEDAVASYKKALTDESLATDARGMVQLHLASCLARTGHEAEATALLDTLVDAAPPVGPAALATRGDLQMTKGDLTGAIATYEKLVAARRSTESRLALLEALQALLEKTPDEAHKSQALSLCAVLMKDTDTAARQRAIEIDALLRYGAAAREMLEAKSRLAAGDSKGAIGLLESAQRAQPTLEEAAYLYGLALSSPEVNRKSDARAAWKRAPHVKEAQSQLGVDAYEGGDLDEAESRLRAATDLDGGYQAAWYELGLVLREAGRVDDAKRAFGRAVTIDKTSELGRWAATKLSLITGQIQAISEGQVIDASSEVGIGQAIVQQASERFGRIDNPALEERLTRILKRLATVSDRPERELRYQVVLVDVPIVNALTVPGGTVLVFKGLIDLVDKRLGGTDDAWASVLGHECAHAALRHGAGMIHVASSLATGKALMGQVELAGLLNTVSRVHEFEADQFGVLYAYRAGFNPVASIALHEAMLAQSGEIPRGMTHPTHKERIERVRDYLLDLRGKVRGFDLAVKALGNGDYDAATQRLEIFLAIFPDSTSARSNLGVAMHRKALLALTPATRYRRATDVDPNSRVKKVELRATGAEVAGLKAQPKMDERLLRAAVAEYESALAVDAGYPQALTNLGAALVDLHDKKRAVSVLERAVKAAPKSREAWNNLGTAAAEIGQTPRAREALNKAVALDGNYADGWFNLALLEEQAGRPKEALLAWDRFLTLDAKSGWADIARAARERLSLRK